MPEKLLTQKEVAELLGISVKSVARARKKGFLKAYVHPHFSMYCSPVHFKKSEVQRYIKEELIPVKEFE